ncbi:hypothetical protein D3C72_2499990 [compost metagenome]
MGAAQRVVYVCRDVEPHTGQARVEVTEINVRQSRQREPARCQRHTLAIGQLHP